MRDDDTIDADDGEALLASYDLAAWTPPPVPPGLPDAVIARARQPAQPQRPGRRAAARRWWPVAALGLAAAAIVALALWGVERAPTHDGGELKAEGPREVRLGASSIMVEAGADLAWRRDGDRLTATQRAGSAVWRVGKRDTLVIDAGAMVASVEATGASLRVEVEMDRVDARAIGISGATTAIAAAIVTVAVYQGQVRVTSDGRTVDVPAGTITVFRRRAEDERTVGVRAPAPPPAPKPTPALDPACAALLAKGHRYFATGFHAAALAAVEQAMACAPAAQFAPEDLTTLAVIAACHSRNQAKAEYYFAKLPATQQPAIAQQCFAEDRLVLAPTTACDAAALKAEGDTALATGSSQSAVAAFERSFACSPDPSVARLGYVAACRARDGGRADAFLRRMPATSRATLVQVCIRVGIDADPERPPCQLASQVNPSDTRPMCKGGVLRVTTTAPARLIVDGVDTNNYAPAAFELAPGSHKITFAIGSDRFTWPVTVKAGEVTTLAKNPR